MRLLELPDLDAYREHLNRQPDEWQVLDEMCRITISRFYRDRGVFDLLRNEVFPALACAARERQYASVRVWSAGCASGEEPWTLKLMWELELQRRFPKLSLEVVATDADTQMLERARLGRYRSSSIKDFPESWLSLAFAKRDEEFRIRDRFRKGIEFQQQDIRQAWPSGSFDLILCRHLVFTYFDERLQTEILEKLTSRMIAGGILVTGKQESLPSGASTLLELVVPHSDCYRWRPRSPIKD